MVRFDEESSSSAGPTLGGQDAEEAGKKPTEQVSINLPQIPATTARARAPHHSDDFGGTQKRMQALLSELRKTWARSESGARSLFLSRARTASWWQHAVELNAGAVSSLVGQDRTDCRDKAEGSFFLAALLVLKSRLARAHTRTCQTPQRSGAGRSNDAPRFHPADQFGNFWKPVWQTFDCATEVK